MIPSEPGVASGSMSVLGWALMHFLWQGSLVALLLQCALALSGTRASRLRYALCCLALALMAVLPAATFARLSGLDALRSGAPLLIAPWVIDGHATLVLAPAEPWTARFSGALNAAAPILPWIWIAGVVLCAARLALGLAAAHRMLRVATSAADQTTRHIFTEVAAKLGVTQLIRLLESNHVDVPTVVSRLRPAVLLPVGCFAGLSTSQVETILAHELVHIRRHDYLVSVLQSVVESLLFYHPAVWRVSRQLRRERECCCDEIAATFSGNPLEYAYTLSLLEEQRLRPSPVGLSAAGGVLRMRIQRLLGFSESSTVSRGAALAILAIMLSAGGVLLALAAQPSPAPNSPALKTRSQYAEPSPLPSGKRARRPSFPARPWG